MKKLSHEMKVTDYFGRELHQFDTVVLSDRKDDKRHTVLDLRIDDQNRGLVALLIGEGNRKTWVDSTAVRRVARAEDETRKDMTDFKPGLYKHYKGGMYRALFTCTHHETGEVFVAYVSQEHLDSGVKLREWCSAGKDSWTDILPVDSDMGLLYAKYLSEPEVAEAARRVLKNHVQRFTWVGP